MHDRCLEKIEEDTYVAANKSRDAEPEPKSSMKGQIYDCEKECYVDAEGTPLTGSYGQPFPS